MSDAEFRADSRPVGPTDPVTDAYKQHIDRTLLRENLKLSYEERLRKLIAFLRLADELRAARRS